jgi:hypothetical protein
MSGDGKKREDPPEAGAIPSGKSAKKVYKAPTLIRYGTLAEVTGNMVTGSIADSMGLTMTNM